MVFDPATLDEDIQYVDGLELITYTPRNLEGTAGTAINNLTAFREGIMTEVSTGDEGWATMKHRTTWHLKGNAMGATIPKRGDRITSLTSGTWEVDRNTTPPFGKWYTAEAYAVA